ncbi:hypothetical protein OF83DRAFT_644148 [Amylostereum chailletii]|nr:hypothetical protein OF83DRAFT_644148 [Amylostereum chailletii]
MVVQLIHRKEAIKEHGSFFDALEECELDELANGVFICGLPEYDGYMPNPQELEMLTNWWSDDEFVNESPFVYIEDIDVSKPSRGKGIGCWAYTHLLLHPRFKGAKYIITRPAYGHPQVPEAKRSVAFHRKVGFRRIGSSMYFAYAKDPHYPSRLVPPSKDQPFKAQVTYF